MAEQEQIIICGECPSGSFDMKDGHIDRTGRPMGKCRVNLTVGWKYEASECVFPPKPGDYEDHRRNRLEKQKA